ncbi:MAG: GNAT family N-acetyltransferase [Stenomitos rutilans HA7619-LM2]|jgi:GNAT superfamily N-acetyltransferase|nr:GNAT family N-acetyltransferase [Stenomitos rutilans HA7619-LM2]
MIEILRSYVPGSIGRVVELHGIYYAKYWHFEAFFEAKVADGLAEFMNRYNEERDGFWVAVLENRVEASIAIDGIQANQTGVHLRWFIVSDVLRGQGVGRQLLNSAIEFCRRKQYRRVYLWTFEGLDSARHLYEIFGFKLVEQYRGCQWGVEVNEQKFELQIE